LNIQETSQPEQQVLPHQKSSSIVLFQRQMQNSLSLTPIILFEHPLGRLGYMVINLVSLFQETIEKYDLNELAQDGKVYIDIQKEMYGLPQAGILTNELLQRNLAQDGYRPTTHTHGLWTHDTRPIPLSLVVDDFGVKCVGREHAEPLMTCIKKNIAFPATGMARHTVA
jgi:hypothetical protein